MGVWSEVRRTDLLNSHRFDSDYFKPEYIKLENQLLMLKGRKLKYDAVLIKCGPFGSTIKNETYKQYGVIVARPFNINNLEFEYENIAFISEDDFKRKNLISCQDKDIFFSRVGDVKVGILNNKQNIKITISPNIVLLRLNNNNIKPEYATVFFNTSYGIKQILRAQKVVAQPTISTSLLNNLFVFDPGIDIQIEISEQFNEAMKLRQISKSLYTQAKQLLEKELGLDKLILEKPKSYETSYSEIMSHHRMDADYFQTHFKIQDEHLKNLNIESLGKIVNFMKGIEVGSHNYTDSGKLYIRVSNVKENGIIAGNSDKYISDELYNSLREFKPDIGDILLTKDGTIGECYVIDRDIEGIISGGIMKMTLKDSCIPAEYLCLVINSRICKFQIDRVCSGALILHWKPKDIANLKIPILDEYSAPICQDRFFCGLS